MSRLLSLLLLYKNGFDAGKYVSFEEQINKYEAYDYESLRQSSDGWESGENIYYHQTLLYSLGEAVLDGGRCFTSTPQTKAKAVREIEKSYNFVYA